MSKDRRELLIEEVERLENQINHLILGVFDIYSEPGQLRKINKLSAELIILTNALYEIKHEVEKDIDPNIDLPF